jgi:hypothetical protein
MRGRGCDFKPMVRICIARWPLGFQIPNMFGICRLMDIARHPVISFRIGTRVLISREAAAAWRAKRDAASAAKAEA